MKNSITQEEYEGLGTIVKQPQNQTRNRSHFQKSSEFTFVGRKTAQAQSPHENLVNYPADMICSSRQSIIVNPLTDVNPTSTTKKQNVQRDMSRLNSRDCENGTVRNLSAANGKMESWHGNNYGDSRRVNQKQVNYHPRKMHNIEEEFGEPYNEFDESQQVQQYYDTNNFSQNLQGMNSQYENDQEYEYEFNIENIKILHQENMELQTISNDLANENQVLKNLIMTSLQCKPKF